MALPLDGQTAIVLGTGPELPADKMAAFQDSFTIGVNRFYEAAPNFIPTVAFWIDGGVTDEFPEWYGWPLCVCDASAKPQNGTLQRHNPPAALPMRADPLPKTLAALDPRQLYHRPNTAVVAAIWALSLGARWVVMCGCDCEDDGRRPDQLAAMRTAKAELLDAPYRVAGDHRHPVWPWPRCVSENPVMWASYTLSPRMTNCNQADARRAIRRFYEVN